MGIVLVRMGNSDIVFALYPAYHMPNNPQHTLGLPAIKYYNNMRSVRMETLAWIRLVDQDGRKVLQETIKQYHTTQLMDYIHLTIVKVDPERENDIQHINERMTQPQLLKVSQKMLDSDLSCSNNSTTLSSDIKPPRKNDENSNISLFQNILIKACTVQYNADWMTSIKATLYPPIINASFTDHGKVDWTILHRRFDHIKDDKLAKMCTKQLMEELPARFPKKEQKHKTDCWICPRGTLHHDPHGVTMNTAHLRPGQLIHMDFYFINRTSIRGFTSVLLILDARTRKMWQFPTQQKRPPLDIVTFFLTQLQRMGRAVQHIRTDCGGELAGSSEFCALVKNTFQVGVERTGTYSSWLNGKVERHAQTACGMLRVGQIDHGLGDILWCCKCEDTTQKYNATLHNAIDDLPDFEWYGRRPKASEFRIFGCKLEAKIGAHVGNLDERTEPGYYLGTTATKSVIRYWKPEKPYEIQYCTTARFFEHTTVLPNGQPSPGSSMQHPEATKQQPFTSINISDHPFHNSPPHVLRIQLPPKGTTMGITIKICPYHNLPYIQSSTHGSPFQKEVPLELRHNVWIIAIANNNPISVNQVKTDIINLQHNDRKSDPILFVLAKRSSDSTPTQIEQDWATFDQMRIVPYHIIDTDAIQDSSEVQVQNSEPPPPPLLDLPSQDKGPSDSHRSDIENEAMPNQDEDQIQTEDEGRYTEVTKQVEETNVGCNQLSQEGSYRRSGRIAERMKEPITVSKPQKLRQKPDPPPATRRSKRRLQTSVKLLYPSERQLAGRYTDAAKILLLKEILPEPCNKGAATVYHKSYHPRINKLFHTPKKPDTPPHIGAALTSPEQTEWLECLYNAYDKMHATGTLSIPFSIGKVPEENNILRPRVTCEVRITDTDNYYELKCRLCADGSRMVMGIDYDLSYAPVIDGDILLLMIAVATSKSMQFYFMDISNAFQSNIIHDPKKRHYMHLPPKYMEWFRFRFPLHPLSKQSQNKSTKMVLQTIRGIQGTKDAGAEWYKLLALILTKEVGMIPATGNKGLFYWNHKGHIAMLALATDDILLAATDRSLYEIIQQVFDNFFAYTTNDGEVLQFLNYRIIQSSYGTSIDQYNHIRQTILQVFFHEGATIPFHSSPFPLETTVEMDLFRSRPLTDEENAEMTKRYNGSYMHWTGVLLHIASKSRWDLEYLAMRLSGYNNCPSIISYEILYKGMCYLFHHPHIPIMYPRPNKTKSPDIMLSSYFGKGEAEMKDGTPELQAWTDADLARDIVSRRSTTSTIHTWGDVAFAAQCVKQPDIASSTNDAEVRSLFYATKRTLLYRSILRSIGRPQQHPTVTHEDNAATIAQVIKDRLTPRVKHIDILISWLNEQYSRKHIEPVFCTSDNQAGDMNTKPHGGYKLQEKYLPMVGHQHYPPPTSTHYKQLQLHQFNISTHRGSFLIAAKSSTKSSTKGDNTRTGIQS